MTPRSPAGWPARLSAVLTSRWALPVLGVVAFATSLWIQHAIYPGLSWNRDEPVYLWQVDLLRSGQLTAPDGGHPDLLQPWLSASRDGSVFSQYTLGWPLVLLVGALLGSPGLGVALGATLTVVGTWVLVHEVLRDCAVATLAASLVVVSPFFLVHSGLHLSYLFALGLGLLVLASAHRGSRRSSAPLLLCSGGLLGWIFLTRPFDAVIWGALAAVPMVIHHRRRLLSLVGQAAWVVAGAAPFIVLTLVVNRHLTGSPTEFPITVADPLDAFGFGDRRLMPRFSSVEYGPRLAFTSMGRNVFWMPFFLIGAHLGAVLAAVTAWRKRRDHVTWLLIALGLAFPVAYLGFFGTHISSLTARLSAPIYYLPSYVPIAVLIAMALVSLGRRHPSGGVALTGALLLVTLPISVSRLIVNRDLSRANQPWRTSVSSLSEPSIVVTSPATYLLFLNPFGDNGADLDGPVIYATDNGPALLTFLEEHPDRAAYLQRSDLSIFELQPSEHPRVPRVSLTPLVVLHGEIRITGVATVPAGRSKSVWWLDVDGVRHRPAAAIEPSGTLIDIAVRGLDLADGLHTLDVLIGPGFDDASATPAARRRFYARVIDGDLAVLAPGTAARFERPAGRALPEWIGALSLDHLRVDPTTVAP